MSRKNEILLLALPVIMENILQTLLGTTDTYFAGQMADEAIAGIDFKKGSSQKRSTVYNRN